MMKTYLRGGVALAAMTLALQLAAPQDANAQAVLNVPPPTRYTLDERGVDVRVGSFNYSTTDVVIGQPGQGGLTYERAFAGTGWRDNLTTTIMNQGGQIVVSAGGYSEAFTASGSSYTPVIQRGSKLANSGSGYTWTWSDGTVVQFNNNQGRYNPAGAVLGFASSLRRPNGEEITYTYQVVQLETPPFGNAVRLVGVTNNFGYGLKVEYAFSLDPTTPEQRDLWGQVFRVTGYNFTTDYCDPEATTCTLTGTWPRASYGQNATSSSVTDTLGNVTNYTYNTSGQMTGVRLPGSAQNDLTIIYASGRVSAVNVGGGSDVWSYAYSDASGTRTTTITDPLDKSWQARSNIANGTLTSWRDPLLNTTSYEYDAGKVDKITLPEGNSVSFEYDLRGNITETTITPKTGSGQSAIVTSATYQSGCTNPVVCNQPASTTDGRGAVTDYSYDPDHGGLTLVIAPAPETGAVRPRTRIEYGERTAHYKDASGNIVNAPSSVTLPVNISQCITGSSCNGGADETETNVTYGSTTSTVANNLLPTAITNRAGNGAVSATITIDYDRNGDPIQIDGPVSGMTTRNRYDAGRRQIGSVGPDPDGSGPLAHRAVRYNYNDRGQVTATESGTVAGFGDGSWAAFAPLQYVQTQYDDRSRPVMTRLRAGTTTYSSSQTRYGAAGRVECAITLMTSLNTLRTSCTPQTGSTGPDRIASFTYDDAGRVLSQARGVGTADVATEAFTWTANSKLLTARDGDGHLSTLEYDGFDRLRRLRYPNASGSGSSTSDDEHYGYDANSNLTDWTNRAGTVFALDYDALNRLTYVDPQVAGTPDVHYEYDNLGRVTKTYTSSTQAITRTYDQLSRLLSETTPQGQMSFRYDAAGNRTRITWPDAFYVAYGYNLYSQATSAVQGGSNTLATYAYDNLGRRTTIGRPTLPTTTYGYSGPRLTSLSHNLTGSGHDVTLGFQYNPAGQIVQRTVSNDWYVWDDAVAGTINYANNGRNQVTSAGGTAVDYDANGNIDVIGSATFAYDPLNRMTSGGGQAMLYDPDSRLYGLGATRYGYVGGQIAAVYAGTTLQERYVPGPGIDETVAYFDASGNQRMVFADERGSTMGYTNQNGYSAVFNTYDEFGVPGAGNGFGMQYTGQFSLPSGGGYFYKTRSYNPNFGRFMQPDPIRYGGGPNIYVYASGDPINRIDPFGLDDLEDIYVNASRCPTGRQCFTNFDILFPRDTWSRPPLADGGVGGEAQLDDLIFVAPRPVEASRVDCNSEARQIASVAQTSSQAAGLVAVGAAVVGAEPVAVGAGAVAVVSDVVATGAGVYVGFTEGDWSVAQESAFGAFFGKLGGGVVRVFGGSVTRPVAGVVVTRAPSAAEIEIGSFASGEIASNSVAQTCN